jgi:DNA-binding cell septation regulator SpoVG
MNETKIIVEIKAYKGESDSLKAFADVTLCTEYGELTLKGFRVLHKSGKEPWVAFPDSSYEDKDGKKVHKRIVEASKALNKKICDLILEEYAKLSR